MKKNRSMRVAALLLALTLITSCFVGGTFAKYVTSNNAEDGARVARWGVTFIMTKSTDSSNNAQDLFTTSYAENNDNQSSGVSVKSTNTSKLVAPGTSGNMVTFKVKHASDKEPEVSYEVTFDISEHPAAPYLKFSDNTVYEPIQWKVKLGDGQETTYTTLDAMVEAVEAYKFYYNVDDGKFYEWNPGNDGANGSWESEGNTERPTITINWEWPFENSSNDKDDYYDTLLGHIAAGFSDFSEYGINEANTAVRIELTGTATQLD